MATSNGTEVHSTQQGIEDSTIDYYDIMVIGKTGMGKSTTADKLLVANPNGDSYRGSQYSEPVVKGEQLTLDNLSIWILSDAPDEELRVKTRLKNLHFFRSMDKPHQEINQFHAGEQLVGGMTLDCELISNESTKVRVLDVPGFFGQGDTGAHEGTASEKAKCTIDVALNTMRKILLIQAAMHIKFRRILYFLPEQGGLKRSSSLLELELTTMANYFGRAVFECMVVIATLPTETYECIAPDQPVKFPELSMVKTRKYFDIALANALPKEKKPLPKPPIVFISLTDSCETVFGNIDKAAVASNQVTLKFEPMICARCGIKAKMIKSEKIAAYTDDSESSVIPYDESTCHPMLVPKYTSVAKFFGGVAHLLTFKQFLGKWPSFRNLDEVCIACRNKPGSRGCMKINSVYPLKGKDKIVEHTQDIREPLVIIGDDEHSDSVKDEPDVVQQTVTCTGPAQQPFDVMGAPTKIDDDSVPMEYDDIKG